MPRGTEPARDEARASSGGLVDVNQPTTPEVHLLAIRLAQQCRRIVQACLREEEWIEADRQFYAVIRTGLESLGREREPR